MMEDIKIAREEGIHQKCLEHRLKLSSDNETVLIGTYIRFYFFSFFIFNVFCCVFLRSADIFFSINLLVICLIPDIDNGHS